MICVASVKIPELGYCEAFSVMIILCRIIIRNCFEISNPADSDCLAGFVVLLIWYSGGESNSYQKFRKLLFYPLNYRSVKYRQR